MTTLENLYYGNIAPHEYEVVRGSEYDITTKLVIHHEQELSATLTERQNAMEVTEKHSTYDRKLSNFTPYIKNELTVDDGATETKYLRLAGKHANGEVLPEIEVSGKDFPSFNWLFEKWGAKCILEVDKNIREHLRYAIQQTSENAEQQFIYQQTGWKKINGEWYFLLLGDSKLNPLALASNHSDEFYAMATEKGKAEAKKYYASAEKEKSQLTTRLHELDNIIRCLYEDRVVGHITPERYDFLASGYEEEQVQIRIKLNELNEKINEIDLQEKYVKEFIAKAKEYIDIDKLTPEILRAFIKRIDVYEKEFRYSRTCGNTIVIQYTFRLEKN